ncbi:hypothetical protein ACHWQZ_G017649 [Mnemiopsis leidyi]
MSCLLLHDSDPRYEYDDVLSEKDIQITNLPVLQVTFLNRDHSSDYSLGKHNGIIVSSKHGAAFLIKNKVNISGKTLAIVGPATAKIVGGYAEQFDDVTLVWEENATLLSQTILSSFPRTYSWVFCCGNKARVSGVLPTALKENGVELKHLVVYTVEKRRDFDKHLSQLDVSSFKAVVFFSPSGVEFAEGSLSGKLSPSCVLVAFGKSTAATLTQCFGDKFVISICEHPTPLGEERRLSAVSVESLRRKVFSQGREVRPGKMEMVDLMFIDDLV